MQASDIPALHVTCSAGKCSGVIDSAHPNNVGKQANPVSIEILADFLPPFHNVLQHPNA